MDKVVVVNFGGQYAHLIARRIREARVYSEIVPYTEASPEKLRTLEPRALVLSGGPASVYEPGAPSVDPRILDMDVPILGICYGHQLVAKLLGGRVERGKGEYGRTLIEIVEEDPLFEGWNKREFVWMSHADYVAEVPNAKILAISENGYVAAYRVMDRPIYGVQFHPEVKHTPRGMLLLKNFLFRIAGLRPTWRVENLVDLLVEDIRRKVGPGEKVLVAVSGGVDSTVTAALVKRAVGDRLVAVFVNHGLLREGEVEEVLENLKKAGIEPIYIDASERFLKKIEGVADCEERRRIIGEEFARVFKEVVEKDPSIKWLAQGTTYPDVVESGAVVGADRIKSHHNVAALPRWLGLKVLEPLRSLYKDEVRKLGLALGIPEDVIYRHPFPGPGLAVRVIGRFTREKLEIVRKASRIVEEVLKKHGLYRKVWQAFAVVGDDKWVGVKGDKRSVGYIVTVRIVESEDAMTADWARLPHAVMDEIARRITTEIPQVTMVTYAITTKPPATIEPC
ncbi:MAG: GMP synthase (glutamine-hydrolyzing) [Thermoprotei archaeon]|nr:MAG: GMP synthase (glutamine-hydrolyzing) [Thermoprotei archaeon]